jgi:hypothetical protein
VIDEEQLRELSPAERLGLIRALVALDRPPDEQRSAGRRRMAGLVLIIVCGLALAAWTGLLAVTLPRYYRSGGWRGAWVGFDLGLLVTFAVTGWAAWKRRQVLIICLVVLATLLCCDAWFDVVLDARTKGFEVSLLSAVLIELPLAAFAISGARRLLRLSHSVIRRYEGQGGPPLRLRHVPLIGARPGSALRDLFGDEEPGWPAVGPPAASLPAAAPPPDGPAAAGRHAPGPSADGVSTGDSSTGGPSTADPTAAGPGSAGTGSDSQPPAGGPRAGPGAVRAS